MKYGVPAFILASCLGACDSGTEPRSNVQFSLSACAKNVGKRSAGDGDVIPGRLVFRSGDSISFSIPMELNCSAEFAVVASVVSAETLSVAITDVGDVRARCACEKEMLVGFRSKDADLGQIGLVKTGGKLFNLK